MIEIIDPKMIMKTNNDIIIWGDSTLVQFMFMCIYVVYWYMTHTNVYAELMYIQ